MTRQEIMANRILPKQAVADIISQYQSAHYPSFEELRYSDHEIDTASLTYVSPEKVQRMPPEEVVDYLANTGKDYETNTTSGIVRLLALATGRTENDISQAVFGTGDFDAKKFYQPTALQKECIRLAYRLNMAKQNNPGINAADFSQWPAELQDDFRRIYGKVPTGGWDEFWGECSDYIQQYMENGAPLWLY